MATAGNPSIVANSVFPSVSDDGATRATTLVKPSSSRPRRAAVANHLTC